MNHYCAEYDDTCEGCQPAIMDPRTGQRLPEDSAEMKAVRAFWKRVPLTSKQACHRVWCHSSQNPSDLHVMEEVARGMQAAMSKSEN